MSTPRAVVFHDVSVSDILNGPLATALHQDFARDGHDHPTVETVEAFNKLMPIVSTFTIGPEDLTRHFRVGITHDHLLIVGTGPWRFEEEGNTRDRVSLYLHLGSRTQFIDRNTQYQLVDKIRDLDDDSPLRSTVLDGVERLELRGGYAREMLALAGLAGEMQRRLDTSEPLRFEQLVARYHLDPLPLPEDAAPIG